jgi:hypothetical protein
MQIEIAYALIVPHARDAQNEVFEGAPLKQL